ncbi:hypothetical protein Goari_018410 [Gossypium aridum]|uniref:Uncharacterized protein n=1 Tax=Gossypium aridum TaxID=34290 RepID=A0A7J8WPJ7_GOSAI|nr:hypothetical protein [Gossypium aridum]
MARQIVVLALVTMALFALVSTAAAAPAPAPAPGGSPSGSPGDASSPPSQASAPSPSSGAALEISAIVGVGAAAVAGYFMKGRKADGGDGSMVKRRLSMEKVMRKRWKGVEASLVDVSFSPLYPYAR